MAPYGSDITEPIPYNLGNPAGSTSYNATAEAYDVAISGYPFFLDTSDDTPYRRVTAQYRRQQLDLTREAGEQSLLGWWFRSQSSFHLGQGIKYFEPIQDESLRFQYKESKGVDIFTKGQATLINDVDPTQVTTSALKSNGRPNQYLRSVKWTQSSNTYQGCLMLDGYNINKIFPEITATVTNKALTSNVATLTTSAAHGLAVGFSVTVAGVDATFNGTYTVASVPSTTTFTYAKTASNVASTASTGTVTSNIEYFVSYNPSTEYPIYAFCDDGVYCYWITKINDASVIKTAMYKRPIDSSASATQMWKTSSVVVSDAVMEFTKERIVACINNAVYEISTTASALPSAVYTHPVDDFVYTSITSSGAAIYCSGYSGSQSNIQKFTLTTSGAMPTLTSAITAAEIPVGELIFRIYYYLGFMAIGTSLGVRMAAVSDTDGSIAYGPLVFESEQPVYDFAARGQYLWCATNVDGAPGTTQLDLGTQITPLVFPYSWSTYYFPETVGNRITGRVTTACAFIDGTDRIAFSTNYTSSNGAVYIETSGRLVYQGYIETGFVRYNTLENKIFKFVLPKFDTANGGLQVSSIDASNVEYSLGSYAEDSTINELAVSYPNAPQQYLAFKFTMLRGSNQSLSPLFTGYQIKALPSVPRQRLIQYPLSCYDFEMDKFGVQVGYEGRAWDRMSQLQTTENIGDTIRIQDFRTGESFLGIIEELDFVNRTPTDKRFTGFGGVLMCTIRSV